MRLDGRVALVTGATGHVGRAALETLAELGASTAVLDLDPAQCQRTAEDIQQRFGVRTCALAMDLKDADGVRQAPGQVADQLGRLDILIHSAAYVGTTQVPGWAVPFSDQSVEAWDDAIRVNLTSAFLLAQAAEPQLRSSGHGSVIFIGSIYGCLGPDWKLYAGTSMSNPAAYGASKGGLLQLTRYLATVLAPAVRVNMISPGGIARGQPEPFQEKYRQRTPLERMGTEEDLKGALAYLAGGLSAYVTGQNLMVDGGWSIW
jgi:NAD(P)-dependent dehydrogenase (short-subunit alcohol dehydrogenase family)